MASSPLATVRKYLSRYGLIALLLVLPVAYGINDLVTEGDLSRLGNNLVDGISNGAIWALIALGYTLVYGIIELINFAHGEVFMLGSFVVGWALGHPRPWAEHGCLRAGARPVRHPARRDGHLRLAERDDRTGRLPARYATRPNSPP